MSNLALKVEHLRALRRLAKMSEGSWPYYCSLNSRTAETLVRRGLASRVRISRGAGEGHEWEDGYDRVEYGITASGKALYARFEQVFIQ